VPPPSPLWYTSRGIGLVLLLVLTATVVLGITTSQRWASESWPRFVLVGLHRNLSLLALPLLAVHGLTVVVDSFVHLGLKDITVPFVSSYRQLWLGFGVLAGELLIALTVTSLVRARLGIRLWRLIHWLGYAVWPLAVLHGLGTGSDSKQGWALLIYGASVAAVLLAVLWRLSLGSAEPRGWQLATGGFTALGFLGLIVWTITGPLQPGWALAAGTPTDLLATPRPAASQPAGQSRPAAPSSQPSLPAGLNDSLQGRVVQASGGLELQLTDVSDPSLQITIEVPSQDASFGPLTMRRQGQTVCSTHASFLQGLTATCGKTKVVIQLQQTRRGELVGELQTS
jgi:sulfoxide reductase heme-binding subunit YedZ